MEFYQTFKSQFELLPRITVIYGKGYYASIIHNGIAIEWLWFGVLIKI